jgi:hypothetical protein
MKVTSTGQHPVRHYREKKLETEVVCDKCSLRFTIYGVFGWCPDCGSHNSLQILGKNLELASKELLLANSVDAELAEHLVGDALENVVSAFDGFGREICFRRGANIRFQNLVGARRHVRETFDFDFVDELSSDSWKSICRIFQKRHVLSHKMGVIDGEYVQRANDPEAVVGRRVRVTHEEVSIAIGVAEALGQRLFKGLFAT